MQLRLRLRLLRGGGAAWLLLLLLLHALRGWYRGGGERNRRDGLRRDDDTAAHLLHGALLQALEHHGELLRRLVREELHAVQRLVRDRREPALVVLVRLDGAALVREAVGRDDGEVHRGLEQRALAQHVELRLDVQQHRGCIGAAERAAVRHIASPTTAAAARERGRRATHARRRPRGARVVLYGRRKAGRHVPTRRGAGRGARGGLRGGGRCGAGGGAPSNSGEVCGASLAPRVRARLRGHGGRSGGARLLGAGLGVAAIARRGLLRQDRPRAQRRQRAVNIAAIGAAQALPPLVVAADDRARVEVLAALAARALAAKPVAANLALVQEAARLAARADAAAKIAADFTLAVLVDADSAAEVVVVGNRLRGSGSGGALRRGVNGGC